MSSPPGSSLETVQKELEMTTKFAELERASWQRERELLQQQVHLARAAATGTGRREGKVGCFWDYENCSVSLQTNATRLVQALRAHLQPHGPIAHITIYQDVAEQSAYAAGLRSGLEANGVQVRDCGRWGRKDVADHHIMADIALFALDNPPPATICLMSGDKDFSYLLSSMRNRGYDILLFENQMGAAEALKASANKGVFKFRDLIKEAGTTADPTGSSINPPAAAPPTPASSKVRIATAPAATNGRHRANSDPLSPAFLAAVTSTTAGKAAGGTATSAAAAPSASRSSIPADTNPFTLGSKTKTPLPSSSIFPAGPSVSAAGAPAAPRKTADRYRNLIEVLRGMPKSRPLRSYVVPFLNRESWGAGVSSKDFFADAVDAGVITAGKGEQLGMEWISLTPTYKAAVPAVRAAPAPVPTSPVKQAAVKLPAAVQPSPAKQRQQQQQAAASLLAAAQSASAAAAEERRLAAEEKKAAEEKRAADDKKALEKATQAAAARLASMSLSKELSAASTPRSESPANARNVPAAALAAAPANNGNNGRSNAYGALEEETLRAESPPSSPTTGLPSSPALRQLSGSAHDAFANSPARKFALNKVLENNPDPMAAIKLFQPLIQLLSTLPARPPPLRYIASALLRASHPKIYEAYGWKSYAARAEDEGIVDLSDAPARVGKGRKETISLRDRFRESKHEMIVVESAADGKVPPFADKTAELFAPLINALSKLPPASTPNKTPATYVKTMSGQLAGQGLAFLDDVGVNCMADYFTLAKRMGVIRMGMGKNNDPASEWLALKKDYQRSPAAAGTTPESQGSQIVHEPPRAATPKAPTPPPPAKVTPATPTPAAAPAAAAPKPSPKQALSDFSFSFTGAPGAAANGSSSAASPAAAPATPSKRATSPLARTTTMAASTPAQPQAKTAAAPAQPAPAAAAPKPAAKPAGQPAAAAAPKPAPAPSAPPKPVGAPDGSLFRSLEQQLDLSLNLSDSDSE